MEFIKNLFKKTITKVMLALIILSILLTTFFFWGWYVKQINKVRGFYYVYKGDEAYHSRKLQRAINYYNLGLKYYPEHAKARCNLGNIYVMFEDFYSASDAYETALQYKPNFMVCRMNLGIIEAEKLSEFDSAIQEYDTIIRTRPTLIAIPFIFDNRKSTKINRALASYNKGLAYRGKSVYMGDRTYMSNQYLEKAKESYKYAIKTLKKDYDSHYNLALTSQLLGDYKTAGLHYCKAISIEPMYYEAHYNLAILLKTMGMYAESISEFEKAGMLLDARGDVTKTRYVYEVLNEVNQKIIAEEDEISSKDDLNELNKRNDKEVVLHDGKIDVDEQDEYFTKRYFKSCPSKKTFEEIEING